MDQSQQMTELQQEVKELSGEMLEVKSMLREVIIAIKGSEISRDGGLAGIVEDLRTDVINLKKENEALRKDLQKSTIYLNLLFVAAGFILSQLFIYIISPIFKK